MDDPNNNSNSNNHKRPEADNDSKGAATAQRRRMADDAPSQRPGAVSIPPASNLSSSNHSVNLLDQRIREKISGQRLPNDESGDVVRPVATSMLSGDRDGKGTTASRCTHDPQPPPSRPGAVSLRSGDKDSKAAAAAERRADEPQAPPSRSGAVAVNLSTSNHSVDLLDQRIRVKIEGHGVSPDNAAAASVVQPGAVSLRSGDKDIKAAAAAEVRRAGDQQQPPPSRPGAVAVNLSSSIHSVDVLDQRIRVKIEGQGLVPNNAPVETVAQPGAVSLHSGDKDTKAATAAARSACDQLQQPPSRPGAVAVNLSSSCHSADLLDQRIRVKIEGQGLAPNNGAAETVVQPGAVPLRSGDKDGKAAATEAARRAGDEQHRPPSRPGAVAVNLSTSNHSVDLLDQRIRVKIEGHGASPDTAAAESVVQPGAVSLRSGDKGSKYAAAARRSDYLQPPPSRPGAVAVNLSTSNHSVDLLDQRIRVKIEGHGVSPDNVAAESVVLPGAVSLRSGDKDSKVVAAAAPQRSGDQKEPPPSRPGAVAVNLSSSNHSVDLLDQRIRVKIDRQGLPSNHGAAEGVVQPGALSLQSGDKDIAGDQKQPPPSRPGAVAVNLSSSNHSVDLLDQRIRVKIDGQGLPSNNGADVARPDAVSLHSGDKDIAGDQKQPPSSHPGAVAVNLSSSNHSVDLLDQRIRVKIEGQGLPSKNGAVESVAQPGALSLRFGDKDSKVAAPARHTDDPHPPPSRPGSAEVNLSTSNHSVDLLDQRIREKMERQRLPPNDTVAERVRRTDDPQPPTSRQKPASVLNLSSSNHSVDVLDQRIREKIERRLPPSTSESVADVPGAVAERSTTDVAIMAKLRERSNHMSNTPQQMADDLDAKISSASIVSGAMRPGAAYATIASLEERVLSKELRRHPKPLPNSSPTDETMATADGVPGTGLEELEQTVVAMATSNNNNQYCTANNVAPCDNGASVEANCMPIELYNHSHEEAVRVKKRSSNLTMMVEDDVRDMSRRSALDHDFSEKTYGIVEGSGRQYDSDMEHGEYGGPDEEGLAVAFAVEEDDDDMYIPSAVEYDPDAKPPMYRSRRFRLSVCMSMLVVILATVGAVVGINRADYTPPQPLPDRAVLGIRESIEQFVGTDVLGEATNPYSRALDWIQNVDAMTLTPENSTFHQRYILAYIYFATSAQRPWTGECGPPINPDASTTCYYERLSTIKKASFAGSSKRWLSAGSECEWFGVSCDELDQVTNLDLSGTNMTGIFPEGIMLLPGLQKLDMGIGELQGTIPSRLGSMKHLLKLQLYYNQFTGTIPESLYRSRVLQLMNVGGNKLKGQISASLTQLSDLRGYYIFENQIAGSIPTELFGLVGLQYLYLSDNSLSGSIHTEIGRLTRLFEVFVSRNNITSTIPTEIGQLTALIEFTVDSNQITGSLPQELTNLIVLEKFIADHNQITGVIPSRIGNIRTLEYLNLDNNLLGGTVPTELGLLEQLIAFTGSGNSFTGTVPNEVCRNRKRSGSNRLLEDLEMDCAAGTDGVGVEIVCPENCCTLCCDSQGTNCKELIVD